MDSSQKRVNLITIFVFQV